jgi:AcrR family transcriptional regulator
MSDAPTKPAARRPRAADRIRASARDLFYSQGIRAVGVDEIVTRAGVTKPSLYRSFASKDDLACDYLRGYADLFWSRFDLAVAGRPDDPKGQLTAFFQGLAARLREPGYRGCALSNAAVEYPQETHPARAEAVAFKTAVRARFLGKAQAMGVREPQKLADSLLLLVEGAFNNVQIFGPDGPSGVVAEAADALIEAALRA